MKIESFTIKNYRSIKALKVDNLNPVNVFFGKNNVGKSNILRGLYLTFYSLKGYEIFLPDTIFHNRNIYRPIEITVDLILAEDFCDAEKVSAALNEEIRNTSSVIASREETVRGSIEEVMEFLEESASFKPLKKLCLKMQLDSSEEPSDVRVSIKDLESDYEFDYMEYRNLYRKVSNVITEKVSAERERAIAPLLSRLSVLGVDPEGAYLYRGKPERYPWDPAEMDLTMMRLERNIIGRIREPEKRREALVLIDQYRERIRVAEGEVIEPFSRTFNIVKEYFDKISDNFILIPNKEYFVKGPFAGEDGKPIEIFSVDRFMNSLATFIGSPGRKERELIQRFTSIFNRTYSDLGKLESIAKFRNEVLAIFGTNLISLPIEEQGLGIQDLFLYLAHMILFDSAIIAIEEPEGGLSTENQRILHDIIKDVYSKDVYSRSDKQIFLSSHSEEFETPNSYITEMGKDGTKLISRMGKEEEYEKMIDEVLIKRKLVEEKERYEALLKEISEKQMALDVLNYIDKLGDKEKIDAQRISKELDYDKEKVAQVLREITKEKQSG